MKHILLQRTPKENALLQTFIDRITKRNNDLRVCFIGDTGAGKSWAALRLAYELDETFNANRVIFQAKEFMKYLRTGGLKRGQAFIFDEAGLEYSNRKFYTEQNIAINNALQSIRYKGLIIIFTTPALSFIDCGGRAMFHAYFQTHKIFYKQGISIFKPFLISYNARTGKRYDKHPIYYRKWLNATEKRQKIERYYFKRPPAKLVKEYEHKRANFIQAFLDKETNKIKVQEQQESVMSITDIMNEITSKPKIYQSQHKIQKKKKVWNTVKIVEHFGVSLYKAREIAKGLPI